MHGARMPIDRIAVQTRALLNKFTCEMYLHIRKDLDLCAVATARASSTSWASGDLKPQATARPLCKLP